MPNITDFGHYFVYYMKTIIKALVAGIIFAAIVTISLVYYFKKENKENLTRKQKTKKMAMVSILSAFSVVLYFLGFPLPFFVSFLDVQFSNLPVYLASFMFGPVEGIVVSLIRTLIKIPFTKTMCVGELQDLIISITISCISGIVYFKNKTRKGALLALVIASLSWVLIALLSNVFISVPFYIKFMFGGNNEVLVNMIKAVIPNTTSENYLMNYLLLSCLPFNILLSSVVSLITFLVYKRTSILFKKFIYKDDMQGDI